MPLSPAALTWLQRNVRVDATSAELDARYDSTGLPHKFNVRQDHAEIPTPPNEFYWRVSFFESAGEPVIDPFVTRTLYLSTGLFETNAFEGRVVVNESCFVRQKFQRQGFASALYAAEEILYRAGT